MKVMVAGSRGITSDISEYIPKEATVIITGGAAGVDTMAEKYADEHNLEKIIVRPDYKRYGKAAPIVRNHQMIEMADLVIAVWDGKSRGTTDVINYCAENDKRLKIYNLSLK